MSTSPPSATGTASSSSTAGPWPHSPESGAPPEQPGLTLTPRPVRCRQCRGLFLWASGTYECRGCARGGAPEVTLAGGGATA